jgi:hypothetical protein
MENFDEVRQKYQCLGNTGNLIWSYGTKSLMDTDKCSLHLYGDPDPGAHFDAAVYATANMIYETVGQVEAIVDDPYINVNRSILVGAGCQAQFLQCDGCGSRTPQVTRCRDLCDPEHYNISARFGETLRKMRQKFVHMTVRGTFTRDVLSHHNVKSEPLGCPSLMISTDPKLGSNIYKRVQALKKNPDPKFIISLPGNRMTKKWNAYFIGILQQYPRSCYVAQDDYDLLLVRQLAPGKCVRRFGDFSSWQEFSKDFDAVIGSRIHGAMAPLSVGLPSYLIAPDFRVQELAASMGIPFTTVLDASFNISASIVDLFLENADVWLDFDAKRRSIAQRYVALLSDIGVPCSTNLLALAAT